MICSDALKNIMIENSTWIQENHFFEVFIEKKWY